MLRKCVFAAACAVLAAATAAPARADVLSLTGETLSANTANPSTSTTGSGTCNQSGTSTFDFTASGIAGPTYPGTFTETGTVTFGPVVADPITGNLAAQPTSLQASFTIYSGATTITGTKTLSTTLHQGGNFASCFTGDAFGYQAAADYTAIISTPTGTFRDTGISSVDIFTVGFDPSGGFQFVETFTSTGMAPCDPNSQQNQTQGGNQQGCQHP
jgi:hypothetical protein